MELKSAVSRLDKGDYDFTRTFYLGPPFLKTKGNRGLIKAMAVYRPALAGVSASDMACAQALLQLHYAAKMGPTQASSPPQGKKEGAATFNLARQFKPAETSTPSKMANMYANNINSDQEHSPTLTPSLIESMQEQIYDLQSQIRMQQAEIHRLRFKLKKYLINDSDSDEEYEEQRKRKINKRNANKTKEDEVFYPGISDEEANDTEVSEELDNSSYLESKNVLRVRNVNSINGDLVPIGDGYAQVPARLLKTLNWSSYTTATRKLLTAIFPRRVLATHSLTGKPSPAFPDKPAKKKLDPNVINDIVQTVAERCHVAENMIRTSITTKCADESKMFRTREQNQKKKRKQNNRENIPPSMSDSD